jgi:hypothetical protein
MSGSTALLNPALALTRPHIAVLLSATRVCLAGQARPKPSTRSRLEGGGDLRDLRQRGSEGGGLHTHCLHCTLVQLQHLSAQCMGGGAACLFCFCKHIYHFGPCTCGVSYCGSNTFGVSGMLQYHCLCL